MMTISPKTRSRACWRAAAASPSTIGTTASTSMASSGAKAAALPSAASWARADPVSRAMTTAVITPDRNIAVACPLSPRDARAGGTHKIVTTDT